MQRKFLFQSALKLNKHNPKIYVVNTESFNDTSSNYYAKARYEDIFKGYDIDYRYCCKDSLKDFNAAIEKL